MAVTLSTTTVGMERAGARRMRITAWRSAVTPPHDPIRNATPENLRAFQNVEDYFLN